MSVNTRVASSNQEQLFIHKTILSVFLTDLRFIRIQKRRYAEASRRVFPRVVDGLARTNKIISCNFVVIVVVLSGRRGVTTRLLGIRKIFSFMLMLSRCSFRKSRVVVVVIDLCSSYFISLVNARFPVGDDSMLVGQFPDSLR